METLYKKDSKENLRFLDISTDGSTIVQVSGLVDGNHVTNVSQCEGKNIGRANETTPEEQAEIEAQAKYTKKLKEGYFKSKEEATNNVVILPMLAKVFSKEEKKVVYPCFAQPKLDGMRGLGS
jgi:DNA ligase-1